MLQFHEKVKQLFQVDVTISLLYVLLSVFGVVMIYSASSYFSLSTYGNAENFLVRQLIFVVIGMGLALGLANAGKWIFPRKRMLQIAFGGLIVLLLVVFTQTAQKGARSWINVGIFNIQPSEIGKLVLIWASAYYYSKLQDSSEWKEFFKYPMMMSAIVLGLVILQPDVGTAGIIVLIVWLLALMTGFSKKAIWISGIFLAGGYSLTYLPLSWIQKIPFLKPYQIARFISFHNPWTDTTGAGYQSIQGYLALARGGWKGTGLATSIQKTGFLPEAHTDFIMAIVGEELGFIFVMLALVALFGLIAALLFKGSRCKTLFAQYLCYGIGIYFLVQTSVNIGALLGLAPITGVPLPFLSYGGSSYFVGSMAIGMALFALKYDQQAMVSKKEDSYEESVSC